MRIIAGEFRGRKLLPPEGEATRPITDRVKQSLFDILAPSIEGACVLDLFAGTGSLGLECLSRGASRATFFEADRSALKRLRENIRSFAVTDRATVVPGDLFHWFASRPAPGGSSGGAAVPPADLIFLDPPYRFLRERAGDLAALAHPLRNALAPDGAVVFRHDAADGVELPPLERYDERTYGGMKIEFLRPVYKANDE